jgi:hypothetical protein
MIEKPKQIENPNLDELRKAVEYLIEYIWSDEYNEDGAEDYYYEVEETAIETILGKKAYDKINARIDEHESD